MKINDIKEILEAQLLCGDDCLDHEVTGCFACDLISEMLLHIKPGSLLVTSLFNAHVVHTAHVMDASGVVFAGGKKPNETILANAQQNGIPILSTSLLIFECCGRLFTEGMRQDTTTQVSGD
jgi:predicted transcriptional regulator